LRRQLERTRVGRKLTRVVEAGSIYEPDVRSALGAIVRPGWICVDVGAHRGVITLQLAHLVGPSGRVIAFEAHPENAHELERAVAAEKLDERVRVENVAISDGSKARVGLHPGRRRASAEWNITGTDLEGRPTPSVLEVPATSLDAYFRPNGGRVDLVKIDVEGAEGKVLAGMRQLLRDVRPALVLEFHGEAGWAGRQELFDAGYELYDIAGIRLDEARDVERHYHCLALPRERPLNESLG